MTTAQAIELENNDNRKMAKAKEALENARERESALRKELAMAMDSTKTIKAKYELLFADCEKRACERRTAGLIENTIGY